MDTSVERVEAARVAAEAWGARLERARQECADTYPGDGYVREVSDVWYEYDRAELWREKCGAEYSAALDNYNRLRDALDAKRYRDAKAKKLPGSMVAVSLPEMEPDGVGQPSWTVEGEHGPGRVRVQGSDGRLAIDSVSNPFRSPEVARSLAVALLAAHRHVTSGEG